MDPSILTGHVEDDPSVVALAALVREWEPHLDLAAFRDDPLVYEPDGTLYAVGLGPGVTLSARHKAKAFRRGDAIVVPRSVAIDAEPGVDLVAIRHDGTPPYHFRERFIQTWGYEHRPAPEAGTVGGDFEVIPEDDARYRVPCRLVRSTRSGRAGSTGPDLHLWAGLGGEGTIQDAATGRGVDLVAGTLALILPACSYRVEGSLVAARLVLRTEVLYMEHLAEQLRRPAPTWTPEFDPRA